MVDLRVGLRVERAWNDDPGLLAAVRASFAYSPPGDDRATGYLYEQPGHGWPAPLAVAGPALLDDLAGLLDVCFTVVAFQAYRGGTGCDWHTDLAFDAQAVLSLGVTRTFGVRLLADDGSYGEPDWLAVHHGDLVVMPSGFQAQWQHCVPAEPVAGERVSLVFRTVERGS